MLFHASIIAISPHRANRGRPHRPRWDRSKLVTRGLAPDRRDRDGGAPTTRVPASRSPNDRRWRWTHWHTMIRVGSRSFARPRASGGNDRNGRSQSRISAISADTRTTACRVVIGRPSNRSTRTPRRKPPGPRPPVQGAGFRSPHTNKEIHVLRGPRGRLWRTFRRLLRDFSWMAFGSWRDCARRPVSSPPSGAPWSPSPAPTPAADSRPDRHEPRD